MTGGTDYLIKTCNSIAQLSNFLLLFVTLDGCSSHNDITGFQDNEVPSIINSFSVISTTILSMTGGMDYLIRTSNYIAQLSNFLLLFVTLDGCSSHNYVTGFQDNDVPSIVNSLSVSSATVLNKNSENCRG